MTPLRSLTLLVLSAVAAHPARTQSPTDAAAAERSCTAQSARLLILGTYHMENPRLDAVNLEADDVLRPRRQRELADLVAKLARYNPTRIAIEAPYRNTTWDDRYRQYRAGTYTPGRNEIEQIGFQLARRLNLPTLHPVDYAMTMRGLTPAEIEYPAPRPEAPAIAVPGAAPVPAPALSERDLLLRRSTVTEFLRHLNSDDEIRADHAQYMQMLLPAEDAAIYEDADLVTNWYKRNFRIFANLTRITTFPGDRVLLIIGAGHLKILRDLALDAPYYCLVDTDVYLR